MTSEQEVVDWPVDEGRFALSVFEVERGGFIVYPCSYTATHETWPG